MKYTKIEIKNYKSLGEKNCTLNFDTDIIGLVGKNQSGKSNIIKALNAIKICDENLDNSPLFDEKNKRLNNEVEITVEANVIGGEINSIFKSRLRKEDNYIFTITIKRESNKNIQIFNHEISSVIKDGEIDNNIKELKENFDLLHNYERQFSAVDPNQIIVKEAKKEIIMIEKYAEVYQNITTSLSSSMQNYINRSKHANVKDFCENYLKLLNEIKEKIKNRYNMLSSLYNKVFLFEEESIDDVYSITNFDNYIKNEFFIYKLLKVAGIKKSELEKWRAANGYEKQEIQDELTSKFDKNFSISFTKNYKQEDIKLRLFLSGNDVYLNVLIDEKTLPISDCSDGFSWYLNLYTELLYNNLTKALILLDEPATGVHVDFKKEILKQFENIANEENQIVYTTHSPFMIDIDNLTRIQLVEKEKGITTINRNCYAGKTKNLGESKLETLSPITKAIGFELKYSFDPDRLKCNIILEGIIDYFYLNTMWDVLGFEHDKKPHFLPCEGASSEHLVATILLGWGYSFKALFDLDSAGRTGSEKFEKIVIEDFDKVVFFNNECDCEKPHGKCKCNKEIEALLSEDIMDKINVASKTINAKTFEKKVKNGEIVVDPETKENFEKLFRKMQLI